MGEQEREYRWSDVDRTVEPGYFMDYLDTATALGFFQAYKREGYGGKRKPSYLGCWLRDW